MRRFGVADATLGIKDGRPAWNGHKLMSVESSKHAPQLAQAKGSVIEKSKFAGNNGAAETVTMMTTAPQCSLVGAQAELNAMTNCAKKDDLHRCTEHIRFSIECYIRMM